MSDLTAWLAPAAGLVGVALGAKLNNDRTERREVRKAILTSRADVIAELDLEPRTAAIRLEGERRDRVEVMLLGIGLSSWAVWSFLRILEAHEQDKGWETRAVDTERRTVNPALGQRARAYDD